MGDTTLRRVAPSQTRFEHILVRSYTNVLLVKVCECASRLMMVFVRDSKGELNKLILEAFGKRR
jgi:hypothetical protein